MAVASRVPQAADGGEGNAVVALAVQRGRNRCGFAGDLAIGQIGRP